MKTSVVTFPLLIVSSGLARLTLDHLGREHVYEQFRGRRNLAPSNPLYWRDRGSRYLNDATAPYAVNGSAIPDVDFDVGESYAGLVPIDKDIPENGELFFWFFPTVNQAEEDIIIWLNGGPGCSSLEGLLQENGPFQWQTGTLAPVPNPWSWHRLANVVWVEQPIGTGFSRGPVTATSEDDVAAQFLAFWHNFVDLFGRLGNQKLYIAGESYAGMYCPYIAARMLDEDDHYYYNVQGMLIYDPVIGPLDVQSTIPAVPFSDYWAGLHPFNDSFSTHIHNVSDACGYASYLRDYLVYPPLGPQPAQLPGTDSDGNYLDYCATFWDEWVAAILALNPCWDIYQVAITCPLLWDVLGFPGSGPYAPVGDAIYFNRPDVKAAIHAPLDADWTECSPGPVFVGNNDTSPPSGWSALPAVIDQTANVMIVHGALDAILFANGTLLTIQNMTWGGSLGFANRPIEPFFVPYHTDDPTMAALAGAGVFGTAHSERGLTYVGVDLSGHMGPQYAPSAAFRQVEVLLGRVDNLSSLQPFTIDPTYRQSTHLMGKRDVHD